MKSGEANELAGMNQVLIDKKSKSMKNENKVDKLQTIGERFVTTKRRK